MISGDLVIAIRLLLELGLRVLVVCFFAHDALFGEKMTVVVIETWLLLVRLCCVRHHFLGFAQHWQHDASFLQVFVLVVSLALTVDEDVIAALVSYDDGSGDTITVERVRRAVWITRSNDLQATLGRVPHELALVHQRVHIDVYFGRVEHMAVLMAVRDGALLLGQVLVEHLAELDQEHIVVPLDVLVILLHLRLLLLFHWSCVVSHRLFTGGWGDDSHLLLCRLVRVTLLRQVCPALLAHRRLVRLCLPVVVGESRLCTCRLLRLLRRVSDERTVLGQTVGHDLGWWTHEDFSGDLLAHEGRLDRVPVLLLCVLSALDFHQIPTELLRVKHCPRGPLAATFVERWRYLGRIRSQAHLRLSASAA